MEPESLINSSLSQQPETIAIVDEMRHELRSRSEERRLGDECLFAMFALFAFLGLFAPPAYLLLIDDLCLYVAVCHHYLNSTPPVVMYQFTPS